VQKGEIGTGAGAVTVYNAASATRTREGTCQPGTHGHSGTVIAREERQHYARICVQEWQRSHPSLPFADLLSLFRLAGKEWDRMQP
jgi:hypothetical protein